MARPRILLVTGSAFPVDHLAGPLSDRGYDAVAAEGLSGALYMAGEFHPAAAIIVLPLDEEADRQWIDSLRERAGGPAMPVLVLVTGDSDLARVRRMGLDEEAVLQPPPGESDEGLVSRIEVGLEMLRLRRALDRRGEDLRQANEKMTRLLYLKNRFLSVATHDIRTPVTTMKLALDVMDQQITRDLPPGVRRLVDVLKRNLARIDSQVEEFLLIARMDLQGGPLTLSDVDLNALVREAVASFMPAAVKSVVTFRTHLGDVPPIRADRRRLSYLINDLVTSSLERLDASETIEFRTRSEAGGVVLELIDSGVPLAPEQTDDILSGLERGEPTRQTRASLFLAHRLAVRHGGRLDITPGEKTGMIFTVWLPLSPPEENGDGGSL